MGLNRELPSDLPECVEPKYRAVVLGAAATATKAFALAGTHYPVGLLITPTRDMLVHMHWNTDAEKRAQFERLKQAALKMGAELLLLIAEAWAREVPEAELKERLKVQTKDDPDRYEAVFIHGEGRLGPFLGRAVITRDSAGKPSLGPWGWVAGGEGRISGAVANIGQ